MKRTFFLSILLLSFTAVFSVEPKTECNQSLQVSVGVIYQDNVYRNSDLGIEFKLPKGWKYDLLNGVPYSDKKSDKSANIQDEQIVSLTDFYTFGAQRTVVFNALPEKKADEGKLSPEITFSMEPTLNKTEKEKLTDMEAMYKEYVNNMDSDAKIKATAKFEVKTGLKLGSKTYPYFESSIPSSILSGFSNYNECDKCDIQGIVVMKDYDCFTFSIILTYYNEEQKKELMKMIDSIKFF